MEFLTSNKLVVFIFEEYKILCVFTLIFLLYFYYTGTFDHFEKKGIISMKPKIFIGNIGSRLLLRESFHDFQLKIYKYFKGNRFGGFFEGRRPVLYIFDHDVIKDVMIRDFDHFVDRNAMGSKAAKYITRSLLNLKGQEWKAVRSILTPSFSSARLKHMLPIMENCTSQMVNFLKKYDNKDVEMKDVMGHFTLEVIGTCAFGIKSDALTDENAHFFKVAEKFGSMTIPKRIMILLILTFMPGMFKHLNISFWNPESVKELIRILTEAKAERRSSKVKGNDFLQLLVDAADSEQNETENKRYLDEDTIDAQSLLFLIAGYETSSSLLSFAAHVLATRPDIQDTLRSHIEEHTKDKEITYEVLSGLDYLDAFILETLRIYPPVSRVDRVVTKDYTIRGTSITLSPGNVVAIPVYGIHMDPEIYPEPEKFIPERFMGEEKKSRPSHLYLAFGAGPRSCIGLRFAMISAKLALVTLLKNFKFVPCAKTEDPVEFDKRGILLKAKNGLWVKIESI